VRRIIKRALAAIAVLAFIGFLAFLYNIPPFFLTAPEDFGKAVADAAPKVDDIADPAERAIAARGRYVVMRTGASAATRPTGLTGRTTRSTSRAAASRRRRRTARISAAISPPTRRPGWRASRTTR